MEIENVIDIEVESVDEIEADNVADLEVEVVESGPQGDQGIQGPPGLSAYEIYLTHGGTLSEEEWLESLKGETGNTGADGKDGYTPVKGEDYFTEEDIASLNIPTKTSQLENDSGFITEETDPTVPEFIKNITEEDINNWNNAINNSEDNSDFYTIKINNSNVAFNGKFHNIGDSECYDDFKLIIEKYHGTDIQPLILLVTDRTGGNGNVLGKILLVSSTIMDTYMSLHGFSMKPDLDGGQAYITNIQVWVDYKTVDGVIEITNIRLKGEEHTLLTCDNGWTYEPTSDYNPATKKYVDDAIANIDVSGGSDESSSESVYEIDVDITCRDWFKTNAQIWNTQLTNESLTLGLQEYVNHVKNTLVKGGNIPALKINLAAVETMNNTDWEYHTYDILHLTNGHSSHGPITATNRPTFLTVTNAIWRPSEYKNLFTKRLMIYAEWDESDTATVTQVRLTSYNKTIADTSQLSNYLSKTNTTEFTPTADYHPSTKKYVDDAIANIDVGDSEEPVKTSVIYEINVNTNTTPRSGYQDYSGKGQYSTYSLDEDALTSIAEQFTNAYAAGFDSFSVNLSFNDAMSMRMFPINNNGNTTPYEPMLSNKPTSVYLSSGYIPDVYESVDKLKIGFLSLTLSWNSDGVCSCSGSSGKIYYMVSPITVHNMNSKLSTYGYLTKTNTSSYEPTSDYHPAHKKYVDDAIAAAITSVLEAEY